MNKIYKLKFNRETQDLVAVSELATNAVAGSATQDADATSAPTLTSKLATFSTRVRNLGMVAGAMFTCALALSVPAQALSGVQVVAGTATIATDGSVTTITNSPNTIINWQQFNIGKNELVQFIQESSNSAVLNRVLGNEVSEILGTLKSNGKVFLINPNGILFGANAVVDTSALVASTLNMSDADFQAGKYVFNQEKDRAIASVLNQGVIKVQNDGTLALVGGNVVNTGILEAKNGSVYLLAGQSIQIADLNNPLISFKVTAGNKAVNLGEIVAHNVALLGNGVNHGRDTVGQAFVDLYASGSATTSRITATGDVLLYAGSMSEQLQSTAQTNAQVTGEHNGLAVVNGVIDVTNAQGQAGSVQVLADTLHVGAQAVVDATGRVGGSVQLGGDRQGTGNLKLSQSTQVEAGASVDVSGTHQAGSAVVWGGGRAEVSGKYRAMSVHGNGGLIETSGKHLHVADSIQVNTTSFYGERGNWLLDPEHLVIFAASAGGLPFPIRGVPSEVKKDTSSTAGSKSYGADSTIATIESIYNTTIEKALESSDVTLHATSCISGQSFAINGKDATKKLTLDAPTVLFTDAEFTVGKVAITGKSQGNVNFLNTSFTSSELVIDTKGSVSITGGGKLMSNELRISAEGNAIFDQVDLHGDTVTIKGKTSTILYVLNLYTRHGLTLESEEGRVQADFIRNAGIHGDVILTGKQGVMLADTYLGTSKDSTTSATPVNSITITSAAGNVELSNLKLNSTGAISVKGQQGVRGTKVEVDDAKALELSSEEAGVSLTGRSLKSTESLTVKGKTDVTLKEVTVTGKNMTVEGATTTLMGAKINADDASSSVDLKGSEKLVVNGGSITTAGRTELKSDAGSVELTKAQISSTSTSGVSVAAQTNVILQQQTAVQAQSFKATAKEEIAVRGSEVVAKQVELSEASSPTKVVTLDGATLLAGMTKEQLEQFSADAIGLTPDTSAWVKAYGQQITLRDAKVGAVGEVDLVGEGAIGVSAGTIVGNKARLYATMGDLRVTGGTITAKDENRVESKHGRIDLDNNLMKGKTALVVGNMSLTLTGTQLTADETVSVLNGKEGDIELTNVNAKTTSGDICVSATNGHIKVLTGTTLESGADVKFNMVDGSQGDILVQCTVTSAKDVVVTNKNGTTFENAQVTATGSVKALDGKAVTIANSQVQGTAGVTVTADNVEVTKSATVDSTTGTTELSGKTALTVSEGATVSAAMKTQLGGGAITVTDASLKSNDLIVSGTEAVAVHDTDLKANSEFRTEGKTVELTHITSTEGVEHFTASGKESLTVADIELTTSTMTLGSTEGTVQVNNSTLAGRMSFSIVGKGNVDVAQGSKLSSTSLTGLRIESKDETVTIANSQVDAHAQLNIKGNWGTSLSNSKVEAGVLELQKDTGTITISGGVVKTRNSDLVLNTTDRISIRDNAQVISSNNLNIHSTTDGVSMEGAVISAQDKASVTSSSTIYLESTSISAQEVSVTSEAGARINNLDLESTIGKTKLTTENDMMLEGSNSFTAGEGEDILVTAVNGHVDVFGAELQGNHATFTGSTGVGLHGVSGTLKGDLEVEALKNNVSLSQSQVTAHNVALQGENFEIRNSVFTVTIV